MTAPTLPALAALRQVEAIPSAAESRFRAAQAVRDRAIAAGGRRLPPVSAASYAYRRCASCLLVFPAGRFRKDRRGSCFADCATCREGA